MKVAYRLWLEKDGIPVFGKGVKRLLELTEEMGSLHRAAERLKMSYRAAWGRIRQYEKNIGITLIEKGRHGRIGARITPEGKVMIEKFNQVESTFDRLLSSPDVRKLFDRNNIGSLPCWLAFAPLWMLI